MGGIPLDDVRLLAGALRSLFSGFARLYTARHGETIAITSPQSGGAAHGRERDGGARLDIGRRTLFRLTAAAGQTEDMTRRKLDFAIAGAQKSGTCTLDALFRHHPQLQMATLKETHFFDDDERDWSAPDYSALDAFFSAQDERLRGEATPITMYWRPAVRRLRAYNPDIKLVLILRDPVTRAFSSWRQEYSRKRESVPFSEAIREARGLVRSAVPVKDQGRFFSYIERGFYGDQLTYLSKSFPKRSMNSSTTAPPDCIALRRFSASTSFPRKFPRYISIPPTMSLILRR
jgi:hypothetical protein